MDALRMQTETIRDDIAPVETIVDDTKELAVRADVPVPEDMVLLPVLPVDDMKELVLLQGVPVQEDMMAFVHRADVLRPEKLV